MYVVYSPSLFAIGAQFIMFHVLTVEVLISEYLSWCTESVSSISVLNALSIKVGLEAMASIIIEQCLCNFCILYQGHNTSPYTPFFHLQY